VVVDWAITAPEPRASGTASNRAAILIVKNLQYTPR
jgi:hypothetical protein